MCIKFPILPLFCVGLLAFAAPLQAKKKKHNDQPQQAAPEPTPESAPVVRPGDMPSVTLQPFVDSHLGGILAPLGAREFDHPEIVASLKAGYADGQAIAPAVSKPAYQAAQNLCDLLIADMAERRTAVGAWKASSVNGSSETVQPKGGQGYARAEAEQTNKFFAEGQQNAWLQRLEVLRTNAIALSTRERELERRALVALTPPVNPAVPPVVSAAPSPASAPVAVTAALPTPSVSAPAAPSPAKTH